MSEAKEIYDAQQKAKETIQIEVTIEELEKAIKKRDMLDMLENNEAFKTVITEGYLKDNAVRLVHLKGASSMQDEKQQKGIDDQIIAVGMLSEHFRSIRAMANIAEKRLEEYNQELAEMEGNQ
jgi:hypothetical protein